MRFWIRVCDLSGINSSTSTSIICSHWVLARSDGANLTNVGQLLEKHGHEFLGSKYRDPVSSFLDFQEFSVSNPEVGVECLPSQLSI